MCVSCGLSGCVLLMIIYAVVIVWDNGRSGFLGEHSCMDGTPTLRMNEFMLGSLDAKKTDFGHPSPNVNPTPPKEIVLTANDAVLSDIKQAEKNFDELVGAHELRVLHYDAYGKEFIKQFKTSPDAWAQLVKQLAFYKLKGRPGVTYESAQTRKFQRGRTEVIRAASSESKAWVDAMVDPRATVRAVLFRDIFTYISWTGLIRTYNVPYSSVVRPRAMCSLQRGLPTAKV
jgi:carnitine O-acetyltransferase